MSLTEFAQQDSAPSGQNCRTCQHPDRTEIDAGFRAGISAATIERWLLAKGKPPLKYGTLQNHRRARHFEEET